MKSIFALITGSALMLSACQENASREAKPATTETKKGKASEKKPLYAAPDTFKAAMGKAFEGYANIQAALAQDDLAKAKEAFSSMHATLHMMPKEGLDGSTNAYWDSVDTRIMDVLHPMASAETLEATRAYFMDFSLILIEAVEKIGIAGDTPVYQFHCPMAGNNNGGDWLQKESDLANPYFGKAMSTCGELVRKLNT